MESTESDLRGLIGDVCHVFEEIVGLKADPLKEGASVAFWSRRGWGIRDFRMFLEREWKDDKRRAWFLSKGRLRLSNFLLTSEKAVEMIEEKMDILRRMDSVKVKMDEIKASGRPPPRSPVYECICKTVLSASELEKHQLEAIFKGLKCAWPNEEFKKKYFNREYLDMLEASKYDAAIFFKVFDQLCAK